MPSEERKVIALDAIRPRIDMFQAALTITVNQVQGLLAGKANTADDQSAALGKFAQGKVELDRFASFTPKAVQIDAEVEAPVRAAQEVLKSLLAQGDDLFIVETEPGKGLGHQLSVRLAQIEVSGEDFKPSAIVPLLDSNMKIVFDVSGDAPAAALSRVISPGVYVQQEIEDANLEAFAAFKGIAVAAFLPSTAVSFVHDPSAGSTTYERFISVTFPKEVKKRHIGGISPAQQAEDYTLLESLSVPPEIAGEASSDPAGKLSAWLLRQTNLSDLSA